MGNKPLNVALHGAAKVFVKKLEPNYLMGTSKLSNKAFKWVVRLSEDQGAS